ncbi:hypothetical protein AMEX_G2982 [Astyanax mexicanus]|uniref:Uncharacterized protein n=1 Tax=Astyanax mexicanus TaxID=7994 RepID=A0A8T2MAX6_ASTMX|nr:hypothetical protein AMEX_G2982 [Astyanax mexicanus]
MPQVREGGFTFPTGGQHISDQPGHIYSDFTSSRWTSGRTHFDQFGAIGSGHYNNAHGQQQYGQFNSDKSGCSGIKSGRCSEPSDCSGCLGLYTCNVSNHKCRLKGRSHSRSRFLKSLENI